MNTNPQSSQEVKNPSMGLFGKMAGFLLHKERMGTVSEESIRETLQLLDGINAARNELKSASTSFEYADSREMVDYYTYKIKASEVMLVYLLKLAKEKGIRIELADALGIRN